MKNFSKDKVIISVNQVKLKGLLHIPKGAKGLILFVHGSGSSHLSSRNQYVAQFLNEAQFATLLFDLLTDEEDSIDMLTRELRFDIDLLASRLIATTDWCLEKLKPHTLNLGYFGASTGGGAAIVAAAQRGEQIKAIVSRGGRPDLAGKFLSRLKTPTLLIVGGDDPIVLEMNQTAMEEMHCIHKIKIIQGATHLFEEPGTLASVAGLAREWFNQYLNEDKSFIA